MDNICFLNGHLLHDIDNFKKILKNAIENPSGQDYCGILDLIWEGSLENWVKLLVDKQLFSSFYQICSDIRNRNITEYDGAIKILLLFDIKSHESVKRHEYISFDNANLSISGDADYQTVYSHETFEYKIKRDRKWPEIHISTKCKILESVDHVFKFKLVIKNRENDEIAPVKTYYINPHECFYNGEKEITIDILLDDLKEGIYDINFFDEDSEEKDGSIQSTSVKILNYHYDDCFELHSVVISGDSLFQHKTLSNTYILLENSAENILVSLQNEVIKQVDQDFNLNIAFGDNDIPSTEVINTKDKSNCTFTIPVKDMPVGIYQIKITSEGKSLDISDSYSIFITGGKRKINIKDGVELDFIEIVDKGFHYLVSESIITTEIYCKVMDVTLAINRLYPRHPHIFRKNENINFYTDADNFLKKLSPVCGRPIQKISKQHWLHCLDNGSIDYDIDLKQLAWYANNSQNHMHEVQTKSPNTLGIYDICGNIWTLTNDVNKAFFEGRNDYILVGGCYNSTEIELREPKKVRYHSEIEYGLRLMVILPAIQDNRQHDIDYDSYSSYDSVDPSTAYFEREMSEVGALL